MKKTDLAYLAGIFDGEGCIVIHKRKTGKGILHPGYHIEVNLANTNEWIVRQFQFSFGGNIYLRKKQTCQSRTIWAWQVSARKALDFLAVIKAYLKLKRAQAEIAITFQSSKTRGGSRPLSEKELAVAEASKILISNLNKGKKAPKNGQNGEKP